jgi:hypothetical protein
MGRWKISAEDARLLLGGISNRYYEQLAARPERRILNHDRLYRVFCVIAVDKALHIRFPRKQANRWVRTPCRDWPYNGVTPLYRMIDGGALSMLVLARMLGDQAAEK